MILAVDIGNTNIVVGCIDGEEELWMFQMGFRAVLKQEE